MQLSSHFYANFYQPMRPLPTPSVDVNLTLSTGTLTTKFPTSRSFLLKSSVPRRTPSLLVKVDSPKSSPFQSLVTSIPPKRKSRTSTTSSTTLTHGGVSSGTTRRLTRVPTLVTTSDSLRRRTSLSEPDVRRRTTSVSVSLLTLSLLLTPVSRGSRPRRRLPVKLRRRVVPLVPLSS